MGKNSDTKNIFDNYFNNVLLKEAVKATEEEGGSSLNKNKEAIDVILGSKDVPEETRKKLEELKTSQESGKPAENKPATTATTPAPAPNSTPAPAPNSTPAPASSNPSTTPSTQASAPNTSTSYNPAQDPLVVQNKLAQGINQLNQYTPLGKIQQMQDMGKENPSFTQWQQDQADQAEKQLGLPTGPTVDAANQANATDVQKFVQATTGNKTSDVTPPAAAPTPTKTTPAKTASSGSIVDYLAGSGQASDFASRSKMAAQYGIQNYKGTAEQNTQLLNKLKSGEKPTQQAAATTQTQQATTSQTQQPQKPQKQQGMGGVVGGVSKAIGSAGQGLKQATIGTKKPLGGALGLVSKGLGSLGKGVKTALVGNDSEQEENNEEEGWTEVGEPEVENVTDEYETEETPVTTEERKNIAKFLKNLSEKNYSLAHDYLKLIIDRKIKTKIAQRINSSYK